MATRGSDVLSGVAAFAVFGLLVAGLGGVFEGAPEILGFIVAPIGGLGALYVAGMVYESLEKARKGDDV